MRYVFARATTSLSVPGQVWRFAIEEGKAYWADHPAVLAHPSSFSPDPLRVLPIDWPSGEVEQATAAPGEKRSTRRDS